MVTSCDLITQTDLDLDLSVVRELLCSKRGLLPLDRLHDSQLLASLALAGLLGLVFQSEADRPGPIVRGA